MEKSDGEQEAMAGVSWCSLAYFRLYCKVPQCGLSPSTSSRLEMEMDQDPLGISILRHTHLGESKLMRPA